MVVIDAHGHAWTDEDEYAWKGNVTPPGVEKIVYSVDNYLEDLETLEADEAVLVATPIHGRGSPYTMDCLEAHPDTFYGVVLLEYGAEDIAARVDRAFANDNVIGVRLTGDEIADANPALWDALAAHDGQAQLLIDPESLTEAERLASEHPGVQFVVDHLGMASGVGSRRPTEQPYATMAQLAEHSNVAVKLTHTPSAGPYPFVDVHDHVQFLLREFGRDRLLWGSDYIYHFKKTSLIDTKRFLTELEFLSTGDERRILGRNMRTLL
jgi:predicted TIM-barrel fold metal-dependent hydrolase